MRHVTQNYVAQKFCLVTRTFQVKYASAYGILYPVKILTLIHGLIQAFGAVRVCISIRPRTLHPEYSDYIWHFKNLKADNNCLALANPSWQRRRQLLQLEQLNGAI